ncbi:hypothetical protein B0H17DRAFT_1122237, partial [Mycena rosella]
SRTRHRDNYPVSRLNKQFVIINFLLLCWVLSEDGYNLVDDLPRCPRSPGAGYADAPTRATAPFQAAHHTNDKSCCPRGQGIAPLPPASVTTTEPERLRYRAVM